MFGPSHLLATLSLWSAPAAPSDAGATAVAAASSTDESPASTDEARVGAEALGTVQPGPASEASDDADNFEPLLIVVPLAAIKGGKEHRAEELQTAALGGLADHPKFSTAAVAEPACIDADCVVDLASRHAATHVITVDVERQDRDRVVRIEVFDGETGALVASGEATCELCAESETVELVTRRVTLLRPQLEELAVRRAAPVEGPEPEPARAPDVVAEEVSPRPSVLVPSGWVLVAVGLAGAGAGAALWAIDGRPWRPSCEDGRMDPGGRCPQMYTTKAAGIVGVGAGAAVGITGAVLVGAGAKRRRVDASASRRGATLRVRF